MLSTTSDIIQFYSNIISNPTLLADGYNIITKFLFESQQNRRDTLLNLTNPTVPILSLLINIYPQQIFSNTIIDHAEKDSTVQFILQLLVTQLLKPNEIYREKLVSQLFQFMHKIHNSQGFERWVGIYLLSLNRLAQSRSNRLGYFLTSILKLADDRVSVLSQEILRSIVQYQFSIEEQKLEIYYYILKSLSFKVDTDPDSIQSFVQPHQATILQYAVTNMKRSAKALLFSLKIMTLLFGDYGMSCQPHLVKQIQLTATSLITEYITFLNNSSNYWKGDGDIDQDDQEPIEIALYQMLQLFMTLFGARAKLNLQIMVYLCIISTYLGQCQYKRYVELPDQYLMDVDDEGETNVRNKSIYFLQQMIQHQKIGKKCVAFLKQYTLQVLTNLTAVQEQVKKFLQKHKLPTATLRICQLYNESVLFILHSFTSQLLEGSQNKISIILGNEVKNNSSNSIDAILAIVILNKCLKNQPQNQKAYYIVFLREMILKYSNNVGMLIAIARGIYQYSSQDQLIIVNSTNQKGVPFTIVNNLLIYMLADDSAQEESAYLIIEFFIHLLKCQNNRHLLQQIVCFEKEIILLKKYLKSGMLEALVCDFICKMANPFTLQAIYKEIQNGFAKDESLSKIICQCIKLKAIKISEIQIIYLCQKYVSNLDVISEIVSAYIQNFAIQNPNLASFLSQNCKKQWIPGLLKQGKLADIQIKFMQSVISITNTIDSLEQLQNQLLIPYFIILNNPNNAIILLDNGNILIQFFEKVYRYARLFQGTHLKIITSHIFISLAEKLPDLTPKVMQLVRSYGNIESSEWEEDDLEMMHVGDCYEVNDTLIEKMFNRIVNDRVQEIFKNVFGQMSWDSKRLYERLALLQAKI